MPAITITSTNFSGSSSRTIRASAVRVGLKKNNDVKPIETGSNTAYVITKSYENPRYVLDNVYFTGESGTLTYSDVLALLRLKYGVANAPTLTVTYGTADTLLGANGTDTAIKVILESCDMNVDMRESNKGKCPSATLTFVETR